MNETVNQEQKQQPEQAAPNAAPAAEKTFTQAELDRIVADRLSRERAKYGDYEAIKAKADKLDQMEEASKSELQKATDRAAKLQAELDGMKKANEIRSMRDEVAKKTGLPVDMMEFLTGTDEEACMAQAKKLVERVKPSGFPTVKDSGETRTPGITKADILAIKNERERLKAIREHIDLF